MRNTCKLFIAFVASILIACASSTTAGASNWWEQTLDQIQQSPMLPAPDLSSQFVQSTTTTNVNSSTWTGTSISAVGGQAVEFFIQNVSITPHIDKYRVMYRIDPRSNEPQVYLTTYNSSMARYMFGSDINTHNAFSTALRRACKSPVSAACISTFASLHASNNTIPMAAGDTMDITLLNAAQWNQSQLFNADASGVPILSPFQIYNTTGLNDNNILYITGEQLCTILTPSARQRYCYSNNTLYSNIDDLMSRVVGVYQTIQRVSFNTCSAGTQGTAGCLYDGGRGMAIIANGTPIKNTADSFAPLTGLNNQLTYTFHYVAGSNGSITFGTNWNINNMFNGFDQFISDWSGYTTSSLVTGAININNQLYSNISSSTPALATYSEYLHIGRYFMDIQIARGQIQPTLSIEYVVSDTAPGSSASPITVHPDAAGRYTSNASGSGQVWIKVTADQNATGTTGIVTQTYVGSTFMSQNLMQYVIQPICSAVRDTTRILYSNLATGLGTAIDSALTLYIMMYGLYFLIGATTVKTIDLVTRVVKIGIVSALIGQHSWDFFNNYFFVAFLDGTNYLLNYAMNQQTVVGNPFGFIDIILNKYWNWALWRSLLIQLFQLPTGLTFFAILTIYSICLYLISVLQVVTGYLMAFLSLNILIALAPVFITFMLFERTKPLFNNWVSALFNCALQPTALLIFFLLLDQVMTVQLERIAVPSVFSCLIPLSIGLDLSWIGIDYTINFTPLFIDCLLPFYIPNLNGEFALGLSGTYLSIVSGCLIFSAYALLAHGLLSYVNQVVGILTSIGAAGSVSGAGAAGDVASSIKDVGSKIASPVTKGVEKLGSMAGKGMKNALTRRSSPTSYSNHIQQSRSAPMQSQAFGPGAAAHGNAPAAAPRVSPPQNASQTAGGAANAPAAAPRSAPKSNASTTGTMDKDAAYKKLKAQQDASNTVGKGGVKESLKNITKKIRE